MTEKFASTPGYSCTGTSTCYSITVENSQFLNFGVLKDTLADPVAVDPAYMMHYTGQIIDLDGYMGSVKILNSIVKGVGVRYDTCDVVDTMLTSDPNSLTNNYPGYGATKTKYQIKSLISLVNQDGPVQIIGGTFEDNIGTKGIIYIDMKHSASVPRVIIAGITFNRNIGYIDSSVIYIRARGPIGKDVYTAIPGINEAFCGGYTIQSNIFTNNYGCLFTSGGLIKFECVNAAETSTDWLDRISTPVGTTWVSTVYSSGNYNSYAAGTSYSVSYGTTYTFDSLQLTLKKNSYLKNLGSGPNVGLVDLRGASRVSIQAEIYTNNGDSAKDLIEEYVKTMVAVNLVFKEPRGDKIKDAFDPKNSLVYNPQVLLNSMLNIERSTSVSISTIDFKENWLIENGCQNDRSLSIRINDYAGNMVINDFDINTQIGAGGATTHYIKSVLGIDPAQSKSENSNGHLAPMILFTPSVMIKKADFTDWTAKSVKFVEDSSCIPIPTMYFSFPGIASGPYAEKNKLQRNIRHSYICF